MSLRDSHHWRVLFQVTTFIPVHEFPQPHYDDVVSVCNPLCTHHLVIVIVKEFLVCPTLRFLLFRGAIRWSQFCFRAEWSRCSGILIEDLFICPVVHIGEHTGSSSLMRAVGLIGHIVPSRLTHILTCLVSKHCIFISFELFLFHRHISWFHRSRQVSSQSFFVVTVFWWK